MSCLLTRTGLSMLLQWSSTFTQSHADGSTIDYGQCLCDWLGLYGLQVDWNMDTMYSLWDGVCFNEVLRKGWSKFRKPNSVVVNLPLCQNVPKAVYEWVIYISGKIYCFFCNYQQLWNAGKLGLEKCAFSYISFFRKCLICHLLP